MKEQKKTIQIFLITLCLVFTMIISGCTATGSGQVEKNPASPTDTATAQTTLTVQAQPEVVQSSVSWKDYYPEFDEQTKSILIENAKTEIIRLFPDVDSSTLEGYWADNDSTTNGPPRIVFDNVDDTSEEYLEILKVRLKGHESYIRNNTVTIKVDPESGDIVLYKSQYVFKPLEDEIRIVSPEEAEDKALEFVKDVKGSDFLEEKEDDFYICRIDGDSITGNGLAYITLFNTCDGVQYLNDKIYIAYDLFQDTVRIYRDELKDPELMMNLTTLSPVPTISEDEAKKVLETKLNESYPDEDLNIQYTVLNGHENSLNWYDQEELVYSDNPEPVRLIWYISFSDEEMREEDSRKTTSAIIDAHTGEIVSLSFRDISIS